MSMGITKYFYGLSIAALLSLCLTGLARSAYPMANLEKDDKDITRRELSSFDRFLDKHPAIAKDLRQNPSLVNEQVYLQNHPELREFLNNHPGAREELKENPAVFMRRERRFDQSGQDIKRHELSAFDDFLDKHPAIAKDLRQNPSLVNDQVYLQNHAELREFLNGHPGVRQELREDPAVFMKRERRFERHEGHGKK
jgi:phage-related protein